VSDGRHPLTFDGPDEVGDHGSMSQAKDRSPAQPSDGGADGPEAAKSRSRRVTQRVTSAIGGAADYVESAATAVGGAVEATARRFDERPGARVRRVRRLGTIPLPYLHDVHPDASRRTRRELGIRAIDVDDIAGTAVGGAHQRGSDFLPLKPFRSPNWQGRWQRLGQASDRLAILPPIDVLRYGPRYWVLDGHNRVAMAKYSGQAAIDADVTDLVDPTSPSSDPAESFASLVEDSRELRAAVSRTAPKGTSATARPSRPQPDPSHAPLEPTSAPTEPEPNGDATH
jgi:hypothetical protein